MAPSRLGLALAIACALQRVGASEGNGIETQPIWRVITFLVGFVVISTVVEVAMHNARHYCARTKAYGMLHAITAIEEELMLLGFISLILTVVEQSLLSICISDSSWVGTMCTLDAHGTSPSTPIGALQTSAPVEGPKTDHASGPHRRRLLRSGESKAICDAGSSSFLQAHVMHEVPALVTALLARMLLHSVCSHVPREVRGDACTDPHLDVPGSGRPHLQLGRVLGRRAEALLARQSRSAAWPSHAWPIARDPATLARTPTVPRRLATAYTVGGLCSGRNGSTGAMTRARR